MKNKVDKWFLVALAVILVLGVPFYWDWNLGTSYRGYSFQRVDIPGFSVSTLPSPIRHYRISNIQSSSPFEGEIITFVGRGGIHFDGILYEYQVQNSGFALRHHIWVWVGDGSSYVWVLPNITRFSSNYQEIWYLQHGYTIPHHMCVIISAIMGAGTVRNVGGVGNFFNVISIPVAVLSLVYALYRRLKNRPWYRPQ
ncbi:MAG: hypothetical protein FWD97_05495 [Defluviitaleaceae bacterium]|nr:hypothetical protein [Defluviitaleaceae bacterium]